ncbi:hypothetical protein [Mesorhizobium sp. WSM4884]|uniref:hypothetical protein n=1 Tax=Mesorhizobium sp. WSM4884 TaxID=3038542 RepID=UPI002415ED42|nr:hypothetical protein [Mesorhizobium sp. WSM4884]MDG4882467.1 hypothetical protein [Mesorhizobium sp. WSM4884]
MDFGIFMPDFCPFSLKSGSATASRRKPMFSPAGSHCALQHIYRPIAGGSTGNVVTGKKGAVIQAMLHSEKAGMGRVSSQR